MFMSSGPVDLLVLEFLIAVVTSSGVILKFGSGVRFLMFRSIFLYDLSVLWGIMWVNW